MGAPLERDDRLHAGKCERGLPIECRGAAPKGRRHRDGGLQHPRQFEIDPEERRADRLGA